MSADTAPAAMPGVYRLADEFERELFAWRNLPSRDGAALRACAYAIAQKAEALFAPILAEKDLHHATGERITRKDLNNAHRKGAEEGRLAAHLIDGVNNPHNACCYRDGCRALEARALAAEAALAAAVEALEPFADEKNGVMQDLLWGDQPDTATMTITCPLGQVRKAREAVRAAAIRAQGE